MVLTEDVKQERQVFVQSSLPESSASRKAIQESWERCVKMGVDPNQKRVEKCITGEAFAKLLADNKQLIQVATPFMENIYNFVAGSGFVVTLTDRNCIILKIIGDEDIREKFKSGNFAEGYDWSERSAGTNAIGTSLALNKPIQIFAHEHFCRCSHYSTCSSAPIHDSKGNIIGALNMTGDDFNVHCHTLGMVAAAAHAITNTFAAINAEKRCQLANRYQTTIINSISDALLATDKEGHITQINAQARHYLNLQNDDIYGKNIHEVLPENNEELFTIITTGKYVTDAEVVITTSRGRVIFTVTSRPIHKNINTIDGMVLIFNEMKRARKIAQRMAGASAVFTFANLIGRDKSFLNSIGSMSNVGVAGK
ncbi:MAG: PAS domain-containing protein [Peptococcia bacterium]